MHGGKFFLECFVKDTPIHLFWYRQAKGVQEGWGEIDDFGLCELFPIVNSLTPKHNDTFRGVGATPLSTSKRLIPCIPNRSVAPVLCKTRFADKGHPIPTFKGEIGSVVKIRTIIDFLLPIKPTNELFTGHRVLQLVQLLANKLHNSLVVWTGIDRTLWSEPFEIDPDARWEG